MHYLPVVNVGRRDTVQLSGSTTLKALKGVCNWTVTGFSICPEDTASMISHEFYLPNSSKWRVELEMNKGRPLMCFRLVESSNSLTVGATVEASLLDEGGEKYCVYRPTYSIFTVADVCKKKCITDYFYGLDKVWNFECEVSTVEVVTEDTTSAFEEEVQPAVAKALESLFESKALTDITLSAGGVRLDAHRAILCARSPVFRAAISPVLEAQESLVEIPDVEPRIVSRLLRYMYTDIVDVPSDAMEQLLVAFDKYGLQDAKLKCEQELAKQLTVDTAADIAVCAIVNSCSFLQEACVSFIKQNLEQVVGSRGWENMIDKYPTAVKTISELVTDGSERCSPETPTTGSESDNTTVIPQTVGYTSAHRTTGTCSKTLDTVCDSCYMRCLEKKVVYVWTVSGLSNWPEDKNFVASPHFCHPETVHWELRLYKCGTEYYTRFKLLEYDERSVIVDLTVSVLPREGEKFQIHREIHQMLEEGSESLDFKCGHVADVDVLTLECEISMVCVVHQCVGAVKPVLQSALRQDLQSLLESGSLTDFKLRSGTVEMGAHRAVLAARSPFFARMLQPDSEVLKKGQLEVPDLKPEVLAEALRYMYTGRANDLAGSAVDLLAAARRFELSDLKNECLAHLRSRPLTVANAVTTAICAMENQCDVLLNQSVGFIRSHFKQVMGSTQWIEAIDMHPASLKRISQLVSAPAK